MRHSRKFLAFFGALLCTLPLLMGPTGGLPSRPSFQTVTVTAPYASAAPPLNIRSTLPLMEWNETGAAADGRIWRAFAQGGIFTLGLRNDADSLSKAFITATRTGASVTGITVGNATDNPPVTLPGPVTGTAALTASASGFIASNASTPSFRITDTSAGVDGKHWLLSEFTGTLSIQTMNDAGSVFRQAFTATRSAVALTAITLGNATDNPALTVNGIALTPATTTSTGTAVGLTTSPTTTFRFVKTGNMALMSFDGGLSGTSNSTSFSATGAVPAAFQPTRSQTCFIRAIDNGTTLSAVVILSAASGTVTFIPVNASGLWTGSGTKGADTSGGGTCAYALN